MSLVTTLAQPSGPSASNARTTIAPPLILGPPGVAGQVIVTPDTTGAGTTFNDSGTGTLTLSGSATQSLSATDSRTGTLTLAGTSTQSLTGTDSRAGTLTLAGTRSDSLTAADSRAGTFTLGGTSTQSASATDARTVTITLGGTGSENFQIGGAVVYNDSAIGYLRLYGVGYGEWIPPTAPQTDARRLSSDAVYLGIR